LYSGPPWSVEWRWAHSVSLLEEVAGADVVDVAYARSFGVSVEELILLRVILAIKSPFRILVVALDVNFFIGARDGHVHRLRIVGVDAFRLRNWWRYSLFL
jgi:hypothetical protein